MGKALHLNLKYVKPSLLKGPFRYSTTKNKTTTSDDDVPDLASSSCASEPDHKNNKPCVPQEALLGIENCNASAQSHLSDEQQQQEDETDSIPCIQEELSVNNTTSDPLSAVLKQQQQQEQQQEGITADREQRLVVQNCIPANIVLLPDYDSEESSQDEESSKSSLEDRLQDAEALIHSYRSTIRSNENLIDALHKTLTRTREEAMNVMSSHKDLEDAVQMLLEEREEADDMALPEPKIFLKLAMATSLMLYLFGISTEYPLIATVMVFLMEGFL
eukprot:CAMPEP_0113630944 /NCGR_PEP_ID=MMETSP0017_2-20120614/16081_1 /TAXON_ID=2856 /ORGANISM="Cylindrotheca closterium" /LENGTH=274 /DNA_ID=CAMNT_0000541435 /DNA_START=47 /DNA_END=871 /DNA_ORIENTATION=+ /assembly_acc=CAM_ASM_000147